MVPPTPSIPSSVLYFQFGTRVRREVEEGQRMLWKQVHYQLKLGCCTELFADLEGAAHQPIRSLVKASPCSLTWGRDCHVHEDKEGASMFKRKPFKGLGVLKSRGGDRGHHIWMCTQRTCLRPESSPHLVISPVSCDPRQRAHSNTPAEREACSHSAGVRAQGVHPKRLLTSWGEALHAALSTPGTTPQWGHLPCPPQCRPQFLTGNWICNTFWSERQSEKEKQHPVWTLELTANTERRRDHLLPVPSVEAWWHIAENREEHWALLKPAQLLDFLYKALQRTNCSSTQRKHIYLTSSSTSQLS